MIEINLIEETIELIKEYIKTRDESLSSKISKNFVEISKNDELRKAIIDKTELGVEFLEVLILYIRVRYNYLLSLIKEERESRKPLFSNKLIFGLIITTGAFPIGYPVRVLGINISALREALVSFKRKYSAISFEKIEEKMLEMAPIFDYIRKKRRILENASKFIVKKFGHYIDLDEFLSEIINQDIAVRVSYIQALLKLLVEERIRVKSLGK